MAAYTPKTALGRAVDTFEITAIAVLLGAMTLLTFANVIARYVLEANILWALELTGFMNAWMILFGVSHALKIGAHLGVDAVVALLPRAARKAVTMLAVAGTLAFSVLLFVGAWSYWAPFANLAWDCDTSLDFSPSCQGFYEVEDVPMPDWLQVIKDRMNYGEEYEKLPRFIPYAILPIAMALLIVRVLQVGWWVWTDERELIIASHEAEEAVKDLEKSRGA